MSNVTKPILLDETGRRMADALETIAQGATGGLPEGGTQGQVLAKASADDYDVEWVDQQGAVDPQDIAQAVDDWLGDHPEATTTVQDNSITYAKISKAEKVFTPTLVDFWYYQGNKRTDGTSYEFTPEVNTAYTWEYNTNWDAGLTRVYFVPTSGTPTYTTNNDFRVNKTNDGRYYVVALVSGKFYLTHEYNGNTYYPSTITISLVDDPYPVDFLKTGWEPDIMDLTVRYPQKVFTIKGYNIQGAVQDLKYQFNAYHIPWIGWYLFEEYPTLLDSNWGFVSAPNVYQFYNDGSVEFVHGRGTDKDCKPVFIGDGISLLGGKKVISKGDSCDLNKPIGKSIACFGDSITSTGYPEKLQTLYNCVAVNMGGSGNNSSKIRKVVTGIGSENQIPYDWTNKPVDIAIIMAGYNDTYQGSIENDIPATTIADSSNDWSAYLALFNASHTDGTTTGNIGFMIEWLQANHPNVRILLCNYHNNTDSKPTRSADVDVAVKALSEYYGVQYIDVRRTCGINKKNTSTYTTDGLHPNDAGQLLIAKAILRAM